MPEPRYAPDISLPPYSYVPGHDLPHPVNYPKAIFLYAQAGQVHEPPITPSQFVTLPNDPTSRRRALAALIAGNSQWL